MTNADLLRHPDRTITVAIYDDYLTMQRAVDFLSDNKFPVQQVTIIGEDVRLVERILGRWTVAKAAGAGALTGAWFGLLIGILLGVFASTGWIAVLLSATAIGAVWGAIFGATAHAMTGGKRDFASVSALEAARYGVRVPAEQADSAQRRKSMPTPG